MKRLRGTGTAIVTPFKSSYVIDEKAFRELIKWQIKNKIEFIVPCGSTGEAITMTRGERRKLIEIALDESNGRVPVIPGTGTSSTAETITLTRDACEAGADTVLIAGPAYNKPTQSGYYEHFSKIAEETGAKIVIYNVPGRTAGNILPETVLKLAENYKKKIIAIKEASNNMEQIMEIIRYRPEEFSVLSGEDSLTLPIIACGGDGVISVISNEMPKEFSDMVRFALNGKWSQALKLHYKMFDLMKANFIESNPIPVKTALFLMGKIQNNFRLPMTRMSNHNRKKIQDVLKTLKLIR
jgi:4-hydroxy-tetrahydrodipicolinate synthase